MIKRRVARWLLETRMLNTGLFEIGPILFFARRNESTSEYRGLTPIKDSSPCLPTPFYLDIESHRYAER